MHLEQGKSRNRLFGAGALLLIGVALALGFWAIGTPKHEQAIGWDEQRSGRLEQLRSQIAGYYTTNKKLPTSLSALGPIGEAAYDPATRKPFKYRVVGSGHYQLCAFFSTDTRNDRYANTFQAHPRGLYCFTLPPTYY